MEVSDVVADGSVAGLQRTAGFRLRCVLPVARTQFLLPLYPIERVPDDAVFLIGRLQRHNASADSGDSCAPRSFASGCAGERRTSTGDVSALNRSQPFDRARSIAPASAKFFGIQPSSHKPANLDRNAHLKCCALSTSRDVHSIVSCIPAANPQRSVSGSATGSSNEKNSPPLAAFVVGLVVRLRARFDDVASAFATLHAANGSRRQHANAVHGVAHLH